LRRSPLRRRSTTRSTRNIITSVTMARSSRRSHSPATTPSGAVTPGHRTSVLRPVANDPRLERSGQLRPRVELARHNARAPGIRTLGSRAQCRMRSTPNRFVGVFAPRTTPTTRPGKGHVDSPLRSYSVVAPKGTGGRTRRCLQRHVHPVDRNSSRPSSSLNRGQTAKRADQPIRSYDR